MRENITSGSKLRGSYIEIDVASSRDSASSRALPDLEVHILPAPERILVSIPSSHNATGMQKKG